jgi:hypothetical protein
MTYPYYIVIHYEGRLPVPLQFRGTVLAKQFETGRIGGLKAVEKVVTSSAEALRVFRQMKMQDSRTEVYEVTSPNKPRHKILDPLTELNKK